MFTRRMIMVACIVTLFRGLFQVEGKNLSAQHNLVERGGSDWWPDWLPGIVKFPEFCPPICVDVDALGEVIAKLPGQALDGLKSLCKASGSVCQTVTSVVSKFKSFPEEIIGKITTICSHDLTTCTLLASQVTPLGAVPLSLLSGVLDLCDGSPQKCVDLITRLIVQQDAPPASVRPASVPPASVPPASVPPASVPTASVPTASVPTASVQAPRPDVQPTPAVSPEGGNTTGTPLASEGDSKPPPPHNVPTTGPYKKDVISSQSPNGANPARSQRVPHAVLMMCVILLGYLIYH